MTDVMKVASPSGTGWHFAQHQPSRITLVSNGLTVGEFEFFGPEMRFNGDPAESTRIFLDSLRKLHAQAWKEAFEAGARAQLAAMDKYEPIKWDGQNETP